MRTIAQETGLDRNPVRRLIQASDVEDLLTKSVSRNSLLDDYKAFLEHRWAEGFTNIAALTSEIRAQGYRGSTRTVYRYLRPSLAERPPSPASSAAPVLTVQRVTSWIMRDPDNLDEQATQHLQALLAHCPELRATRGHVGAFARMICDLRGDRLPEWMDRVRHDNLPGLNTFIRGIQTDQAAVIAGLTLPYSNGRTEGTVNRIKMLKRTMFGRANFDLLRKRILTPA